MPDPIDVVCVGAGWVTTTRHVPAMLGQPRARVIGIVDPNADRARAAAERFKLPHHGTSIDADWVTRARCATVGVPPAKHGEIVTGLLGKGLHVLTEKPMALTVPEAEEMVAAAERAERKLAVVHNFQFATAMQRARKLLETGELGELSAVYAFQLSNPKRRLPHWYPTLRGGLFYDEAPHLLYLLKNLLGDLKLDTVSARVDRSVDPAQIEHLDAHYEHPKVWAQLTMNFTSPLSEWQFTVVGTKKVIAVDIFRDISILLPNDGSHAAKDILRTSFRTIGEHLRGVVRSGIGHVTGKLLYGNETVTCRFLDAVEGKDDLAGISGRDGLAVVRAMHELLERTGV
jgi:scyllo-inositol 2-dehydrogenase (NADP+)